MLEAKNYSLHFEFDEAMNDLKLGMDERNNFYLIFKEAINNAAKHSCANRIIVNMHKKDHSIEMNIMDDGNGFDAAGIYEGNGMSSLKKRADELNAMYNITSITNEGTTVQLKFKIA